MLAGELGQLLFPDGPQLTAMDYEAEAERGYARAAGLSPAVREKLRRLSVPRSSEGDPANLEQWVDRHLQASTMRLRLMITRAKQVTAAGQPTPMELIVAKHRYLTLVRQLLKAIKVSAGMIPAHQMEALGRVQEAWRTAVREATARAAARRASRQPAWEPRV